MKRLRIGLPPLDQLSVDSPVTFAWLERGAVVAHGQARPAAERLADSAHRSYRSSYLPEMGSSDQGFRPAARRHSG